jgi:DNA-binding CsgD family transcriptional regulator
VKGVTLGFEHALSALNRAEDHDAREAWRALVSGRWSLVESFESDGRRYLLARENPPDKVRDAALTALEMHALLLRAGGASYKWMAYELEISTAATHRLVQSGLKKLGIRNEHELPALFRGSTL